MQKPDVPAKPKLRPIVPPKPKPTIKEKPNLSNNKKEEDETLQELTKLANRINDMQQECKSKRMQIKSKDKQVNTLTHTLSRLEIDAEKLRMAIEDQEKFIQRQRKAKELLSGNEDALERIRSAVESQVLKLMNLAQQWEEHRSPLLKEIQERLSAQQV